MADKRISQLVDRGTVANNDVVPIVVSGATTTNKATISSIQTFMQGNLDLGVTSVGITLGSSGTDVSVSGSPITSSGNITINIPTASATNRGLLSAADWTTFNAKQQAITLTTTGTSGASTLVSGTLNIPNYSTDLSGYVTLGTTQTITAQKTFTTSGSSDTMIISHGSGSGFALDVLKAGSGEAIRVTKTSGSGNAMTISGGNFEAPTIVKTGGTSSQFLKADGSVDSNAYTTNTGTVTSVGLSSATSGVTIGSTPITTSGTITLAIATASGSQNGLLSSTDWTTFNNKQNALTNPITGTGATGQVAYWTGTNSQTGSNNLFWDNTNIKLGIGTNTPESTGLTIAGGGIIVSLDTTAARKVLELYANSTGAKVSSTYVGASSYGSLELLTSNEARLTISAAGAATFSSSVSANGVMSLGNDGTFGSTYKTLGLTGNTTGTHRIFAGTADDMYFAAATGRGFEFRANGGGVGNLNINSNGNVGIGTASPTARLMVSGGTTLPLLITNTTATSNNVPWISLRQGDTNTFGADIGIDTTTGGDFYISRVVAGTISEALRIQRATGNVGIGTASPSQQLSVKKVDNGTQAIASFAANNLTQQVEIWYAGIRAGGTSTDVDLYLSSKNAGSLVCETNGTERMRITSGGAVLVGTQNDNPAENNVKGISFAQDGRQFISSDNNEVMRINRKTSDGVLVFFHQDGVAEGSINVSGTTVSYNGGHLSRWSQTELNKRIEGLVKGTVMSNIDQMAVWINPETGEPYPNEQLNCMKISDVEGDKNVAGVFVDWDNDDKIYTNDMNIAMTGDMIIRIAEGVLLEKGDLLISAGDGTAKPQSDDLLRSNTIAKVTSNHVTCVYEDGSYCVPCVLMAC